jgi:hypothetical protein
MEQGWDGQGRLYFPENSSNQLRPLEPEISETIFSARRDLPMNYWKTCAPEHRTPKELLWLMSSTKRNGILNLGS